MSTLHEAAVLYRESPNRFHETSEYLEAQRAKAIARMKRERITPLIERESLRPPK